MGQLKVYAKSNGISLSQHIEDLLYCYEIIKKKAVGLKIEEDLDLAIKLSLIFHDTGKALPYFQKQLLNYIQKQLLKKENNNETKEYLQDEIKKYLQEFENFKGGAKVNIPHSLFSALLLSEREIIKFFKEKGKDSNVAKDLADLVIDSVAYHHWKENFNEIVNSPDFIKNRLFSVYKNNITTSINYLNKIREIARGEIRKVSEQRLASNLKLRLEELMADDEYNESLLAGTSFSTYAEPPYKQIETKQYLEDDERWLKRIMVSGILMRCDHFASIYEKEGSLSLDSIEEEPINKEELMETVENVKEFKESGNKWQKELIKEVEGAKNVIVLAPTGFGKTLFGLLWSRGRKLIYILPIRLPSNGVFDKLEEYINGKKKVGLLHSSAIEFLIENYNMKGEELKDGYEPETILKTSRELSLPYIVTTGDQIFPQSLKTPHYEKLYATALYSSLVLDEVQAYDPIQLAIMAHFIKDVSKLGGNIAVLTATLPSFFIHNLKEKFNITFREENLYERYKEQLEKQFRHYIKYLGEKDDKEIIDLIKSKISAGKILVIVNTVDFAQSIYEALSDVDEKILIHSRFTEKDRNEKEKEILESYKNNEIKIKVILSTQIAEASLDIDSDVLITEIAPFDILIQRMGRNNRKHSAEPDRYTKAKEELKEPNVLVFKRKSKVEKEMYDGIYDEQLIEETKRILETKIHDEPISVFEEYLLTKNYYSRFEENEQIKNKIIETFRSWVELFDLGYQSLSKREAQKIFRNIETLNVMPEDFLEKIKPEEINKEISKNYFVQLDKEKIEEFLSEIKKCEYAYKNKKDTKYQKIIEMFPDVRILPKSIGTYTQEEGLILKSTKTKNKDLKEK